MKTVDAIGIVLLATTIHGFAMANNGANSKGEENKMNAEHTALATFAGGCFWCMEPPFEKLPGVVSVVSGYTGGDKPDPTYQEVSSGNTGHAEAVQVRYDPGKVDYEDLLRVFWRNIDPTDAAGQFVDRGSQYRTAIFYHDETQKRQAEASKAALAASGRFQEPIVTPIEPAGPFYPAEAYHQDYYKTCPLPYKRYRSGSGRDAFIESKWGADRVHRPDKDTKAQTAFTKPDDGILRERLTKQQYAVTQEDATEAPFKNAYWDNTRPGIYVDVVSGEPLFSSKDKFKSGTGWPSFTRPLESGNITEKEDRKLFSVRTEVRSRQADSHLGHVFDDGPAPTGQRYCINSAALRFIPVEDLEEAGYGAYRKLFDE